MPFVYIAFIANKCHVSVLCITVHSVATTRLQGTHMSLQEEGKAPNTNVTETQKLPPAPAAKPAAAAAPAPAPAPAKQ